MTNKQDKYIHTKELHLWMRHDIDKALMAVWKDHEVQMATEKRLMSEVLRSMIYEKIDNYITEFDYRNCDNREDTYEARRLVANLYIFNKEELEGLLKVEEAEEEEMVNKGIEILKEMPWNKGKGQNKNRGKEV